MQGQLIYKEEKLYVPYRIIKNKKQIITLHNIIHAKYFKQRMMGLSMLIIGIVTSILDSGLNAWFILAPLTWATLFTNKVKIY